MKLNAVLTLPDVLTLPETSCMNGAWIFLTGLITLTIIIFVIRQNRRDKKLFIDQLNRDYRKQKEEEGDTDAEDPRR